MCRPGTMGASCQQASRVAAATGGVQLPGKPRRDGTVGSSRLVEVGGDFEGHRAAVESVSVLFELYSGDAQGFMATGELREPVPSGWTVTAANFEVEWPTDPDRCGPRGGGRVVNCLAAYPAREDDIKRKPSWPASTADACSCGGKPPSSSLPNWPAATATS
jgi:hypothetical protein